MWFDDVMFVVALGIGIWFIGIPGYRLLRKLVHEAAASA